MRKGEAPRCTFRSGSEKRGGGGGGLCWGGKLNRGGRRVRARAGGHL